MARKPAQSIEEFNAMIKQGRELIAAAGVADDAQLVRGQVLISYDGMRKLITRLQESR